MTDKQIGLVIQFIKDCDKEVTAELVLYICNIIDPSVTIEQVEHALIETPGWPPSAQETVQFQHIMLEPDIY